MAIAIIFAATYFEDLQAQPKLPEWPALISFHTVMSAVTASAEKGNLTPSKMRNQELLTQAELLYKSQIPLPSIKLKLRKITKLLVKETKVFRRLAKENREDAILNQ